MLSEQNTAIEKNHQLPSEYTIVPAAVLKKEEFTVPESCSLETVRGDSNVSLRSAMLEENGWLEHAIKILGKSNLEMDDAMTWSSYHGSHIDKNEFNSTITQLMPLFYEKAATAAMIKHGITVQQKPTQFLNPLTVTPATVAD